MREEEEDAERRRRRRIQYLAGKFGKCAVSHLKCSWSSCSTGINSVALTSSCEEEATTESLTDSLLRFAAALPRSELCFPFPVHESTHVRVCA